MRIRLPSPSGRLSRGLWRTPETIRADAVSPFASIGRHHGSCEQGCKRNKANHGSALIVRERAFVAVQAWLLKGGEPARALNDWMRLQWRFWVPSRKAQGEAIGRLVAFDHRSGFLVQKTEIFCVRMRPTGPEPMSFRDLTTPHPWRLERTHSVMVLRASGQNHNFRGAEKSRVWLRCRYSVARWRNGSDQGFYYRT
jgi:hypothetical protein